MIKKGKDLNNSELTEVISLSKKILNILYVALIIGIGALIIFLLNTLGIPKFLVGVLKVISPLFIGFIIAWLFNPLVKKLNEKGLSKILSALIVYTIFLFFMVLFIRVFIPVIYAQINELIISLPNILTKLKDFINEFIMSFNMEGFDLTSVKDNMISSLENKIIDFTNVLPSKLLDLIVSLFSGLGIILLGLVVGLYMLFDFDSISKHFIRIIPVKNQYEIEILLKNIGEEVRKCVNGTLLVALVVFVSDTVGFSIVGLNAPLLFGLFCGITDLIPYIGPYIGGAAAILVGFSQSNIIGVSILIIVIIVQVIENYVLQPVVMSKAMQLHPVTIIIGLLIFGYFFGILGMILATPCLALLKVIWKFIKNKYNLFAN